MALTRLAARPMLSSIFVVGGVNALQNSEASARRAKPVVDRIRLAAERYTTMPVPDEVTLVRINAATQVAAGLALATGRMPRLSAGLLALTLVPTTFAGHRFWEERDPTTRNQQRLHFVKNVSVLGGLIIAAGDTEGRPGLAWRAKHAASDVKAQAKAVLPG